MGWDAYFEQLFERIDGKMLDADKAKYQGEPAALPFLAFRLTERERKD